MMSNFSIGHTTLAEKGTGLTVFLFDELVRCGIWICGSAPATREVEILKADATAPGVNALLLTGGSAFGLDATQGVMRWMKEQGRGLPTPYGSIPIVPAAGIYDLRSTEFSYPTAEDAYSACVSAKTNCVKSGNVGAGTGATVGKFVEGANPMPGGFGISEIQSPSGLQVKAYVVVNAVGDILDEQGNIIAGAIYPDGSLANTNQAIQNGKNKVFPIINHSIHTTLGVVITNAQLEKGALVRISKMAAAGMAKAISPVFTSLDGDLIFSVSCGTCLADEVSVGALSALAMQQAIRNAVRLPYKSADADLHTQS